MIKRLIKSIILLIPTLLFAPARSNAQDISGYPLGYCNGEITTNAIVKFVVRDVEVSGAIFIPSTYASTVKGNDIKAVRVGIGSTRNISALRAWVRPTLDGADLGTGSAASFKQGWNEIALDSPVNVSADLAESGFYIGFSLQQSYTSSGLAALSVPSEGGMWVKCGDEPWTDRSAEGTLCIEGLVYGSSLPRLNVHVDGVTVDKWYIVSQNHLNGVLTVRNLATETVTSLTIQGKIDGIEAPCSTTVACDIAYNELVKLPFTLEPGFVSDNPREISGTFTVSAVNGEADEDPTDNSATTKFYVINEAYPRQVMLEEFTTLSCSNCPRVAGFIHEMLADPQYGNVVNVVCHHAGFGTDIYTIPDTDEQYTWFYNEEGRTYAPAMMLDRAYSKFDHTPVFLPSSVADMKEYVDKRLAEPAVISLDIKAEKKDGSVDITVSGNVIDKDAFCEKPRITVYLVEDNISTDWQAGAGSGYILDHITRAVNSTWGDALIFNNDNTYTYTCSLPYKEDEYKWNDMSVVAMVGNMNVENPMDCVIENSASVSLSGESGIGAIGVSDESEDVIYTIQGLRVKNMEPPGLYIVNGKKVLVK